MKRFQKDGEILIASNEVQIRAFKSAGYEEVEEVERAIDEQNQPEKEGETDPFQDMTIPELKAYAGENGINLKVAAKRDDIIEAIKEHESAGE